MTTWFSTGWRWGGAVYIGFVTLLAGYSQTVEPVDAYLALIVVTSPVGLVMSFPIYLMVAMVDWALGYGLEGSPVSVAVGTAGFAVAAALNFVLLRLAVMGVSTFWHRRHQRGRVA